eukprot:CAMPEP_0194148218 /NCGR_PEP_ID=MMETSP0152-20130528/30837_1 /TAXON_ID=1049557 /ORGANISM="Thalassiothrix antarctica, Strain L6-D1" /LENGTH=137 /DNA_ID=CAMNT_0038849585 /DNA_START=14 /DNA_END=427 /DNA_ORIENTATION=+
MSKTGNSIKDTPKNDSDKALLKSKKSKGSTDLDEIFKKSTNSEQSKLGDKQRKNTKSSSSKTEDGSRKKRKFTYSRNDLSGVKEKQWVDDGLGGIFNSDGYTGRVESGVKVFKAHLFNKSNFGGTPECPFDCECCFI